MIPEDIDPKKARILIVDDKTESLDVLSYFLKPCGYEIFTASDGVEALEFISRELPDIILLDVMMPRLNGFQVCERLKKDERTFHIPIIMITALKELKDKIRALEAGADDFISKPFESVELITRVRSLLRIKFYHDRLIRQKKELEKQKLALEKEDKLKKTLTDLIVHDMKNPLFIIQGNLQMMNMMQGSRKSAGSEKYTRRIEHSSHNLLRIILSLLDISRLDQGTLDLQPKLVNVPEMLQPKIDYYLQVAEHRQKTARLDVPPKLSRAYFDPELLERVLDNLLDYAFKHAPEKTEVLIQMEQKPKADITLKISHQGTPIPDKYLSKMFDPASQVELRNLGLNRTRGFGLVFCKKAIERSAGTIDFDPECSAGARLIITLPSVETQSRTEFEGGMKPEHPLLPN